MAGRPLHQVPVLLSSRRSAGAEGTSSSAKLRALFEAARKVGRELLVEIIAGKHGPLDDDTIPRALDELYALGIKPDWWKLEPQASARLARRSSAVIASERSAGAAASCCSGWKRRRRSSRRPSRRPPARRSSRASRSAAPSSPMRREHWLAGEIGRRGGDRRHGRRASSRLTEAWLEHAARPQPDGMRRPWHEDDGPMR